MNDASRESEIVVGVDGTEAAAEAFAAAAELSRVSGVPLRIVYSWQLTAQNGAAGAAFRMASAAHARARATHWVLDQLGDDATTLRWVLELDEGPPTTNSAEVAHEQHAHPVAH